MEGIKDWLIEVAVKKMGPSAIRGAVLGLITWLAARQGLLAPFGVVVDQITSTITIHYDKLNAALIAGFPAVVAAAIKLVNHQAVVAVLPQTPPQELKP